MPQTLTVTDDLSTSVQVIYCHCHYLKQCWSSSFTPHGITRPQKVNSLNPDKHCKQACPHWESNVNHPTMSTLEFKVTFTRPVLSGLVGLELPMAIRALMLLTHWPLNQNKGAFRELKENNFIKISFEYQLHVFYWVLFVISQHWLRSWLGAYLAPSHDPNQCWQRLLIHIRITKPQHVNTISLWIRWHSGHNMT